MGGRTNIENMEPTAHIQAQDRSGNWITTSTTINKPTYILSAMRQTKTLFGEDYLLLARLLLLAFPFLSPTHSGYRGDSNSMFLDMPMAHVRVFVISRIAP